MIASALRHEHECQRRGERRGRDRKPRIESQVCRQRDGIGMMMVAVTVAREQHVQSGNASTMTNGEGRRAPNVI